ncbi:MAG: GNAT family N-acetyltransferase [Albidovulum sp.]
MDGITITPARAELKDEIKRLTAQTYEEHRQRQPFAFPKNYVQEIEFGLIDAAFRSDTSAELAESPLVFAAHLGDQFLGYVRLNSFARKDRPTQPSVTISDIYVVPEHRGKHVGRALLAHVQNLCRERDWDNLMAQVWSGNAASASLFKAAGFSEQYRSYRFGPVRQARDWVLPKPAKLAFRAEILALALVLSIMIGIAAIIGLAR